MHGQANIKFVLKVVALGAIKHMDEWRYGFTYSKCQNQRAVNFRIHIRVINSLEKGLQ